MRSFPSRLPALVFALLTLTTAACAQLSELPRLSERDLLPPNLAQSSKIYSSDGKLITTLHEEQNRTIIPLERMPQHLLDAVIAIEDQRFYEHDGVDVRAVIRAIVANATSGEIREGGSTITQQYVKNIIISPGETAPKTIERKLDEAALARQLETKLDKDEILERYLNTVYFGQGAYGVEAAAKTYFGKPARKLSLPQSATLAGIIRLPDQYDPFNNRAASKERRNLVLERMAQQDYIDPARAAKAQRSKLKLQRGAFRDRYPAPYFIDYVQRLVTYHPSFRGVGKTAQQRTRRLFKGGLKIHTTVDLDMQAAAEKAVYGTMTFKDDPHSSLVAIEPASGAVRAIVGGRDWFASPKKDRFAKLNLAIVAKPGLGCVRPPGAKKCEIRAPGSGRQAGSAFKPFALAAAIEDGISLAKTYKAGSEITLHDPGTGGPYKVQNYEGGSFGSQLSLLEATVFSVNVVYAQVAEDVGPDAVADVATDMGITTPLCSTCLSTVLGSGEVNPLDMASAYGTFATNGTRHPPYGITKIVSAEGEVLYDHKEDPELESEEVLEPAVAYLTTTALEAVIQRGTGARYGQIGRPAAGKTGTAQEYRDAWFVGYTPDLAASVWVGYPEGQVEMKPSCSGSTEPCKATRTLTGSGVTGGSFPTMIWQKFMLQALSGVPADAFDRPTLGFVTRVIDTREGDCLAGRFTPEEFREKAVFARGTAPKEECRLGRGKGKPVPDVVGFPAGAAREILVDEGFDVQTIRQYSTSYPPGTVVAQDPSGGQRAPAGTTVLLVVSSTDSDDAGDGGGGTGGGGNDEDDRATVPDVLGMRDEDARARLSEEGFEVDVIYERESAPGRARKNRGRVWKQSPSGGTRVQAGSRVTIWVNP
ncbi:MAG TPA: transglycosylase domain-containing protein [Actinomycetota bacterium]|nr:transglycosylase domain-containing protein [Actinomycetota bacterium]